MPVSILSYKSLERNGTGELDWLLLEGLDPDRGLSLECLSGDFLNGLDDPFLCAPTGDKP